ncbi:MAG: ROK family protein [Pedobacter sp.]|nr:MAG: ROK family protein [Pedobacter sp.]
MNQKSSKLPYIGVDIGGSHITAAHIDPVSLSIIDSSMKRERVSSMDDAETIFSSWSSVLSSLIETDGQEHSKIGIAMPGPFDYEKGICLMKGQEKYDALYGINVRTILSERLGIPGSDIIFINDAEAFLRGELASGAAAAYDKAIGITLGTGLGSTSNCNGEVVDMNLAFYPFLDSIAEEYISTRWFLKRYKELTGKEIKNVESFLSTDCLDTKAQIFDEFATNLASFLNDFIADQKPQILVIGGNIAKTWDHFIDLLKERIVDKSVVIKRTEMWEDAALVGAGCTWA